MTDQETMMYKYNRILLSYAEKYNHAIYQYIDECEKYRAEQGQTEVENKE